MAMDFEGSFGDYLYKSMKQLPRNDLFQVNGITGESETVQEALKRAVSVAEGLRKQGVKCEDVVAIVSNYSHNSIAATLGSLFLGASPFPVDPSLKKLELQHMFKVANPKIIFIESHKLNDALLVSDNNVPIYSLDKNNTVKNNRVHEFGEIEESNADAESFKGYPIERPNEQVVAVIQSSGTTGLPKGVCLSHQSLYLQYKAWVEVYIEGTCLQLTPLFWVSGFWLLIFSLPLGFKRVYLTENTAKNIINTIHKYKPKYSFIAPIYLARVLNYEDFDKYDLSSLRLLAVGGSVVPHSTIHQCKEKLPNVKLSQAYGATEIGGMLTIPFDEKSIYSAGKVHSMHTYKIIDPKTNEVLGKNQNGEIIVKSPTLMVRYLLNENASQEAVDSAGFYHTGDIGYEDNHGYLFITGRIKELIKVKNHQVSPAEIEDVIGGMRGVADVAVVGIPHEIDQNHPRALVVKEPQSSLTQQQIIDEVADKLSETKHLLAGVQFVDSLPRNVNGKLRRFDLPPLVKL